MKPTPATYYTVVSGDTIRSISRRAYGFDDSARITEANITALQGNGVSPEGLPIIFAGNRLWLPQETQPFSQKIAADFDSEISIRLDGRVFKGWTASRISRNIANIADGFTFSLPFDPQNADLVDAVRPYGYQKADLFIGPDPYIAAQCIKWSPGGQQNQTMMTIDARTRAGHTIECMAQNRSYETQNATLLTISTQILEPYGLRPVFLSGNSDEFTKVRKEITETDFSFLTRIAQQKGFMITSSDDGGIAFLRANIGTRPVARLIEGESPLENITAVYDGTKRFSSFTAVSESPGVSGNVYTLDDESVSIYRPFVYSADELEAGNLEGSVRWRRSKSLADSTALRAIVTGWRNQDGNLWRENQVVIVRAPSVYIFSETEYIIKGVELTKDEQGGDVITLSLVLPQAYTLDFPESFPWEG